MQSFHISVGGVIINHAGELLVVKRSPDDQHFPTYWEIPGGGIHYGEDPKIAVVREVKEETGLEVEVSYLLSSFPYHIDETYDVQLNYLCHASLDQKIVLSNEHTEYKWIGQNEIDKCGLSDMMKKLILELFSHPLTKSHLLV